MSKIFCGLLLCLIVAGCEKDNTTETIQWIENAPKPVHVYHQGMSMWSSRMVYTLVDAQGNVYYTGEVMLFLPDYIREGK